MRVPEACTEEHSFLQLAEERLEAGIGLGFRVYGFYTPDDKGLQAGSCQRLVTGDDD